MASVAVMAGAVKVVVVVATVMARAMTVVVDGDRAVCGDGAGGEGGEGDADDADGGCEVCAGGVDGVGDADDADGGCEVCAGGVGDGDG